MGWAGDGPIGSAARSTPCRPGPGATRRPAARPEGAGPTSVPVPPGHLLLVSWGFPPEFAPPYLCPRYVLREQSLSPSPSPPALQVLALSDKRKEGETESDNTAAERHSAPRFHFDLPQSRQPASRCPPGLSGGLAFVGVALDPRPSLMELSKSCSASLMGLLIWGAGGALAVHRLGQGLLAETGDPAQAGHSRQA